MCGQTPFATLTLATREEANLLLGYMSLGREMRRLADRAQSPGEASENIAAWLHKTDQYNDAYAAVAMKLNDLIERTNTANRKVPKSQDGFRVRTHLGFPPAEG
jgi:hypothetical protein